MSAGHGYEFPADGFGIRGVGLEVKPGETKQIKIKRLNIAERLYRVTGEGHLRRLACAWGGRRLSNSRC